MPEAFDDFVRQLHGILLLIRGGVEQQVIRVVAGLKEMFVKLEGRTLGVELSSALLVDKVIVASKPGNEVMIHAGYSEGIKEWTTTRQELWVESGELIGLIGRKRKACTSFSKAPIVAFKANKGDNSGFVPN